MRCSAISLPLRSTVIRSEIAKTWSMKCDTNRIATPLSRRLRITRNNCSTSPGSSEEVGSSSTRIRQSKDAALQIATSCCTASECEPSEELASMSRPMSLRWRCASRRVARQSIDGPRRTSCPSITFSATLRFSHRLTSWYTVLMPAACACSGLEKLTALPSTTMVPASMP